MSDLNKHCAVGNGVVQNSRITRSSLSRVISRVFSRKRKRSADKEEGKVHGKRQKLGKSKEKASSKVADKTIQEVSTKESPSKEHKRLVAGCFSLRRHMRYFLEDIEKTNPKSYKLEGKGLKILKTTFSNLQKVGKKIEEQLTKADDQSEELMVAEQQLYKELCKELFSILHKLEPEKIDVKGPDTAAYTEILHTLHDDLYVWTGYRK